MRSSVWKLIGACLAPAVVACSGTGERPPPLDDFNPDGAVLGGGGGTSLGDGGGVDAGTGPQTADPDIEECTLGVFDGGEFTVLSQDDLETLRGYTEFPENLTLGGPNTTTDITTLEPLHCLKKADKQLNVVQNSSLKDLKGLDYATNIRSLTVSRNSKLVNLVGLRAVDLFDLFVLNNPSLTSLTDGVTSVLSVAINNNAKLPQCTAKNFALERHISCNCYGNLETGPCM